MEKQTGNFDVLIDEILAQEVPQDEMLETETEWTTEEGMATVDDAVSEWTEEEWAIEEETMETNETAPVDLEGTETEEPTQIENEMEEEVVNDLEKWVEDDVNLDIDAQIEKELNMINKAQEQVDAVQEEIDKTINIEEDWRFIALQEKLNELKMTLLDREEEAELAKRQVQRYQAKLGEATDQLADTEMDVLIKRPIINTVEWDSDLKAWILALNKANESGDENYKTEALNSFYKFIEKEAGINIRDLMSQQANSGIEAMSSGETSGQVNMTQWKEEDEIDQALNSILS